MNSDNEHLDMSEQGRRKLGVIGRSSTLSQSFEISSYPRENVVTCAEYPNPFPKRYYSRRYRQGPGSCKETNDFYKSEYTIPENQVSGASDSTPLLRLSSLSSQYNVGAYSQSSPLCSSSAPSEENLGGSTNSLHQQTLQVHHNSETRSVDRLSPCDPNATCECQRSPGVLSKANSNESINIFDPTELSIESRTLSKCTIKDSSKLKSGSTGNLHNAWLFSRNGRPGFEGGIASSKTISGSLGSRGIVGAAGLGIGIGAGNMVSGSSMGTFGREFSGTRSIQTTLSLEEEDETKRNLKIVLNAVGWWGVRIFLYSFYLGVLVILLSYTHVATMTMVPITVFLIVLSVVLFVFILFCVCFIVFI